MCKLSEHLKLNNGQISNILFTKIINEFKKFNIHDPNYNIDYDINLPTQPNSTIRVPYETQKFLLVRTNERGFPKWGSASYEN